MNKINKLILALIFSLSVGVSTVKAENSATAYDGKYYSQQVFVVAYNNGATTIPVNSTVILDAAAAVNPNVNLGSYVITTSTSDSVFVFGVTDESIISGSLGRICVRGPHKAVAVTTGSPISGFATSGAIITASNQAGKFGFGQTSDGTVMGRLGYILSGTATTDTGDATNTFWVWVSPTTHK